MAITELLGYGLALLVGISLGLIGSGGSILTVPILVYVMAIEPVMATAYSLFVVGATSLIGGIRNAVQKRVDFKAFFLFGIPSILAVYLTRAWLVPIIPEVFFSVGSFQLTRGAALMLLFSIVMIVASIGMIRTQKKGLLLGSGRLSPAYPLILLEGVVVGIITGLVGAGGGFLLIPALVLLAGMPMKLAVGTSLMIIAAKSLLGFLGDLQAEQPIDWGLLSVFTLMSIIGIFIGSYLSKHISGNKLKSIFGWFVLLMGCYILLNELFG